MEPCAITFEGHTTTLYIDDPNDYIHRCLLGGSFYEVNQLMFHRQLIPNGGVVIDAGANIGNHSIFYAEHCTTRAVVSVEPNHRAITLFRASAAVSSKKGRLQLGGLGSALSDHSGSVEIEETPALNLGATKVRDISPRFTDSLSPRQVVPCDTLDNIVHALERVDFIKIDVEGHETRVLRGARQSISRFRPVLAVEVNRANEEEYWHLMDELRYVCIMAFIDYIGVKNYVMIPKA